MRFEPAKNPNPIPPDPELAGLTKPRLRELIREYLDLLDVGSEQDVHAFLASNTYFFNGQKRLYSHSPIYSKLSLGGELYCDFAFFDDGSYGVEWHFVEIESPRRRLFKTNGELSAAANHAIEQCRSWRAWISKNIAYAEGRFPGIEHPMFHVFLGRRDELTDANVDKLKGVLAEYRHFLRVRTLDSLAANAKTVENLIGENGGGWSVPRNAFSQDHFSNHEPEWAWRFLADPRSRMEHMRRFAMDERLAPLDVD